MTSVDALNNNKFEMKHFEQQKRNQHHSFSEQNENHTRQNLHRKPEIILSDTATANPDTLVPIVI